MDTNFDDYGGLVGASFAPRGICLVQVENGGSRESSGEREAQCWQWCFYEAGMDG
uniref:Uncharacterized protein n=1 Tax=Physcomitrium patens TaxID=3218 RepID=A0A2K1KVY9_PHYPA|nr:hypothetical protein PHYPA_004910 [Physcomitrium patens]